MNTAEWLLLHVCSKVYWGRLLRPYSPSCAGAGITVIGRLKHPPPESHAAKAYSGEQICFYTTMKVKLKETGKQLRFKAGDPMQGAFLLYLDGEEDQELAYARIHHIYKLSGIQVTFRWSLTLFMKV